MKTDSLKWDADGLVTVVVQDCMTGEIRMLAHANRQAAENTLATGYAHFYSRSRQQLWRKGETSGNSIAVRELWADCDGDALIYLADPAGPSCHTNRETCFFQRSTAAGEFTVDTHAHASPVLPRLWAELEARKHAPADKSYTRNLLREGAAKIAAKVQEEGEEFGRALRDESNERVVSEAADITYHMLVGLLCRGLSLRDLEAELARRFGMSGLEEKASRTAR